MPVHHCMFMYKVRRSQLYYDPLVELFFQSTFFHAFGYNITTSPAQQFSSVMLTKEDRLMNPGKATRTLRRQWWVDLSKPVGSSGLDPQVHLWNRHSGTQPRTVWHHSSACSLLFTLEDKRRLLHGWTGPVLLAPGDVLIHYGGHISQCVCGLCEATSHRAIWKINSRFYESAERRKSAATPEFNRANQEVTNAIDF